LFIHTPKPRVQVPSAPFAKAMDAPKARTVDAYSALHACRRGAQWEGSMIRLRRSADFDSIIVCSRSAGTKNSNLRDATETRMGRTGARPRLLRTLGRRTLFAAGVSVTAQRCRNRGNAMAIAGISFVAIRSDLQRARREDSCAGGVPCRTRAGKRADLPTGMIGRCLPSRPSSSRAGCPRVQRATTRSRRQASSAAPPTRTESSLRNAAGRESKLRPRERPRRKELAAPRLTADAKAC
jgi:hypothetical protein